jgi:carotenoid phi-ring synthase / carotenoid chi-ring synthase
MTNEAPSDRFPVVVVGAGLAGLTASLVLAEQGIPPLLLEADALWPGGRLAGGAADAFDYGGRAWSFPTEHGMHAIWGEYHNLRALLERYLDVPLQPSNGEAWINRWRGDVRVMEAGNAVRSRWIPAPFHYLQLLFNPAIWRSITPVDFLSLPGFLNSVLFAVGLDPLRERRALDGLMMDDFFGGWTPNLRATFTGLGVNLLAAPAERISLAAYIAALRFYTLMRRDAWQLQYMTADAGTALIAPMMRAIEAGEGMLMAGTELQRIEPEGDGWRLIVADARRGGQRSLLAERVILAVDPPAARRILEGSPALCDEAAGFIIPEAVGSVAVRLWFSEAPPYGPMGGMFTGHAVPDNFFWLHQIYDDFAQWHSVTGGSAIETHFYPPTRDDGKPDRYFLITALDEVQRAFPGLRGRFVHGAVRRNLRTQTLFRVPDEHSMWVETPWPGLLLAGDWVGCDSPAMWMERCAITGIAAANAVIEAGGGAPYPILSMRQPEWLARTMERGLRGLRRAFAPSVARLVRARRGRQERKTG